MLLVECFVCTVRVGIAILDSLEAATHVCSISVPVIPLSVTQHALWVFHNHSFHNVSRHFAAFLSSSFIISFSCSRFMSYSFSTRASHQFLTLKQPDTQCFSVPRYQIPHQRAARDDIGKKPVPAVNAYPVWFKLMVTVTEMTINGSKSNPLTVTVTVTEKFH